jgi:transcriptional regulator with XRE-family HTH domain
MPSISILDRVLLNAHSIMAEKKLTVRAVAEKMPGSLSTNHPWLLKLMHRKILHPHLETIELLANVLEVPIERLVAGPK